MSPEALQSLLQDLFPTASDSSGLDQQAFLELMTFIDANAGGDGSSTTQTHQDEIYVTPDQLHLRGCDAPVSWEPSLLTSNLLPIPPVTNQATPHTNLDAVNQSGSQPINESVDNTALLLSLLRNKLNENEGLAIAWDEHSNPDVDQQGWPDVFPSVAVNANTIVGLTPLSSTSSLPRTFLLPLAPAACSSLSAQDLLSVNSSSTMARTHQSLSESKLKVHQRVKRTASATSLPSSKDEPITRANISAINSASEYWACTVMYARDLHIGNMSGLPNGPFTDKAVCVRYAEEELLSVVTDMQSNPLVMGTADTKFCTSSPKLLNLVASAMKSIHKKCDTKSQHLTEPNAPIRLPSEVDRLRGFKLIGLTAQGAVPSIEDIRERSASQRKDNAFCHTSPDSNDFSQTLAYDLMYDTFFTGMSNYLGSSRSVAQGIKLYYDTFGYKLPLVPFVTYLPIEALAMCFTALKRTLDLREHGFFQQIPFDVTHYLAFYNSIRTLLYAKAKSDKAWVKRYLIDSTRAFIGGSRIF